MLTFFLFNRTLANFGKLFPTGFDTPKKTRRYNLILQKEIVIVYAFLTNLTMWLGTTATLVPV
jgi:hypothetical protein